MPSTTRQALENAVTALFQTSALLDALRLQIWDSEGLTVTQLRLLVFLSQEEGLGNAELADRLLVTRPSVSALLERLERGGFIRREVSPHDRRGIRIWLEDRGRAAVSTFGQGSRDYAADLMRELSDKDLDQVTAALQRVIEAGRAHREQELRVESVVQPDGR